MAMASAARPAGEVPVTSLSGETVSRAAVNQAIEQEIASEMIKEYKFEQEYPAVYFGYNKELTNIVALRFKACKDAMDKIKKFDSDFAISVQEMPLRRLEGESVPGHYVYESKRMRVTQDVEVIEPAKAKRFAFFSVKEPDSKTFGLKVNTKIVRRRLSLESMK